MNFTSNQEIVVDLFIAIYGRVPTQAGLDFFTSKLDSKEWSQEDIANFMLDASVNPEAQNRYPEDIPRKIK